MQLARMKKESQLIELFFIRLVFIQTIWLLRKKKTTWFSGPEIF
jgi:hypothetical protein